MVHKARAMMAAAIVCYIPARKKEIKQANTTTFIQERSILATLCVVMAHITIVQILYRLKIKFEQYQHARYSRYIHKIPD